FRRFYIFCISPSRLYRLIICITTSYAASFFFQAEDGIRAFHVTGVQTCALPISERDPSRPTLQDLQSSTAKPRKVKATRGFPGRSEERRVGKACSCRG